VVGRQGLDGAFWTATMAAVGPNSTRWWPVRRIDGPATEVSEIRRRHHRWLFRSGAFQGRQYPARVYGVLISLCLDLHELAGKNRYLELAEQYAAEAIDRYFAKTYFVGQPAWTTTRPSWESKTWRMVCCIFMWSRPAPDFDRA